MSTIFLPPKIPLDYESTPPENVKKLRPLLPAITTAKDPGPESISKIGSPPVA